MFLDESSGERGQTEVGQIGMESESGSWDFDIEIGIDNAAIPASILRKVQHSLS